MPQLHFPSHAAPKFNRASPTPNLLSSIFQREKQIHLARTIADLINTRSPFPSDLLRSTLCAHPHSLTFPSLLRSLDLLKPPSSALPLFHLSHSLLPPSSVSAFASKTLSILCRSRDLSTADSFLLSLSPSFSIKLHDRFFNTLIRAHARAGDVRAAVSVFRHMASMGVAPSVFSFNSLLAALLRRGRTRSAQELYAEMARIRVAPDLCTFNTLIRGFCLNSMVDDGFRYFQEMCRNGCEPDVITYNTLLDGLCRAGKIEIARNLFDGMTKKNGGLVPNVVTYTTLIRGYCAKLQVVEALELFEKMMGVGLKPNKVTYNTVIKGLCEARRMDLMKVVLERAAAGGDGGRFKPDICTFNTIIVAHCNVGRVDDALKVLDGMLELRVKPDSATYSTLMRGLCQIGEFARAEVLIDEVLDKEVLVKKRSCVPLMAAYNPIFEYLCKNGKAEKAGMVFRQLLDRRATADLAAFKTVILGHCKEGEFRKGYELVIVMVRRDLVPDVDIYEALIQGFLGKGKIGFAWKALQRMLGSGHRPSTGIFHSVLSGLVNKDGYVKEAADLVMVMLERKVRQSIDLSTEVAIVMLKNGLTDRAFEIVRLLYASGYCVWMEKLAVFLCKDQRFLEAAKILLLCLEMNHSLDDKLYAMVMNGLCATGRAADAFGLFYEMAEKGVASAVYSSLNDLKLSLEESGRLEEANFVSKQINRASLSRGVD